MSDKTKINPISILSEVMEYFSRSGSGVNFSTIEMKQMCLITDDIINNNQCNEKKQKETNRSSN